MKPFLFLLLAIAAEVAGTTALKLSAGFSKLWPNLGVLGGYGAAFYLLSLTLKHIPLGIAYAIWSGLGTAATVAIGVWLWHETLTAARLVGILLIIAGTIVLQLTKGPAT
jgi:multidrug transporter EmrE-like cation transporter